MKVAVVFGGRSVEHEVSLRSARTVCKALRDAGHEVAPVGIAPDGSWLGPVIAGPALDGGARRLEAALGESAARSVRVLIEAEPDVVFPIVHGAFGEDGRLQGLLEMLDLPYVGCGVAASAAAMDKATTKILAAAAGVPVVEGVIVDRRGWAEDPIASLGAAARWERPLFVKPATGGSSVGVRKVGMNDELAGAIDFALGFDAKVLIERGVTGREIEVAVLGGSPPTAAAALGEIVPGAEFYDYADKYLTDAAKLVAPVPLAPEVATRARDLAVRAFVAIGGEGLARVDFFLAGEELILNEINTLPGFTQISMYPRLWELSGLPLPQLVDRLVALALERRRQRDAEDRCLADFLASLG